MTNNKLIEKWEFLLGGTPEVSKKLELCSRLEEAAVLLLSKLGPNSTKDELFDKRVDCFFPIVVRNFNSGNDIRSVKDLWRKFELLLASNKSSTEEEIIEEFELFLRSGEGEVN
jgi:hypothetical protein